MKNLKHTLKKHLSKQTVLGVQLLALPSVITYPDMYALGKKSVHIECRYCERSPMDYQDAENILLCGMCLGCEEKHYDYIQDAKADYMETIDVGDDDHVREVAIQ